MRLKIYVKRLGIKFINNKKRPIKIKMIGLYRFLLRVRLKNMP